VYCQRSGEVSARRAGKAERALLTPKLNLPYMDEWEAREATRETVRECMQLHAQELCTIVRY